MPKFLNFHEWNIDELRKEGLEGSLEYLKFAIEQGDTETTLAIYQDILEAHGPQSRQIIINKFSNYSNFALQIAKK